LIQILDYLLALATLLSIRLLYHQELFGAVIITIERKQPLLSETKTDNRDKNPSAF